MFAAVLKSTLLASIIFTVAGCTKSPVDKLENWAKDVCECKEAACVKTITAKYKDIVDNPPKDLSDEDKARVVAAIQKGTPCAMKAAVGGLGDLLKGK